MVLMAIDTSVFFLMIVICYSIVSKRAYSLGKWHYKATNQYKYWEAIASYTVILAVLFFVRSKLIF